MKISALSIPAALILSACGPAGKPAPKPMAVEIEAVPDSDIPADGSIHVVKRGQFVIAQATLFCGVEAEVDESLKAMGARGIGIDGPPLGAALEQMGQTTQHSDGSYRQRMLDNVNCFNDGKNVVYTGRIVLNRAGKPYRMTLVVRQANTLWQGTLERAESKLHPDAFGIADDTPGNDPDAFGSSALESSLGLDSSELSSAFTNDLKEMQQ